MTRTYELRLTPRGTRAKTVLWDGETGEDAARRYVASHPEATVYATRSYPRTGFFPHVDITKIVEPDQQPKRTSPHA